MKNIIMTKAMAKLVSTALATVTVAGSAVALNPKIDFKDILPGKDTEIVAEAAETETEAPEDGTVKKDVVNKVATEEAAPVEEAIPVSDHAEEIAEAESEVEALAVSQPMNGEGMSWAAPSADEMDELKIKKQQEQAERDRIIAEKKAAKKAAEEAKKSEEQNAAAEKAEQERIAAEKAEQERIAAEKAEQERIAAEKAEQEKDAARRKAAADEAARLKAVADESLRHMLEAYGKTLDDMQVGSDGGRYIALDDHTGFIENPYYEEELAEILYNEALAKELAEEASRREAEKAATYHCSCGFSTQDEGALDNHMMNHMQNGEQCSYSTTY